MLLKYYDYFLPDLKKMGLDIEGASIDSASEAALDMLLCDCVDGPAVWWTKSESLAVNVNDLY